MHKQQPKQQQTARATGKRAPDGVVVENPKPLPENSTTVSIKETEYKDIARMSTAMGIKLRTLFESLSPLLVEGVFNFTKNGLTIRSTNLIIAAEIVFSGREDAVVQVEDYVFRSEKPITLGVSFEEMQSCLSAVGPSDIVSLRVLKEGLHASRPYFLLLISHPSGNYNYSFKIPLLCLENLTSSIPKIEFKKVVSVQSSLFLKILRTASKRGDAVQVQTCVEDGQHFLCFIPYAETRSQGCFRVKFACTDDGANAVCLKRELYSLKYLLLVSKCANLSTQIQIYLKKNSVLGIGLRCGSIGRCFFALAPKKDEASGEPFRPPSLSILRDDAFQEKVQAAKRKSIGARSGSKRRKK